LSQTSDNDPGVDATEKFHEVNRAFEVLRDPELKDLYDLYGEGGIGTSAASDNMKGQGSFGREKEARSPFQRKGFGHQVNVKDVRSADSFFQRGPKAPFAGKKARNCAVCGGTGMLEEVMRTKHGNFRRRQPCRECRLVWDASEVTSKFEFVPSAPEEVESVTEDCDGIASTMDEFVTDQSNLSSQDSASDESQQSSLYTSGRAENGCDFYEVLGVPRNADTKAIKQAYRMLARLYHPGRYTYITFLKCNS
jgi:hypothetical protein